MKKPSRSNEDKIREVKKQIADLDAKKAILSSVLEKLEQQHSNETGQEYPGSINNQRENNTQELDAPDKPEHDPVRDFGSNGASQGAAIFTCSEISDNDIELYMDLFIGRKDVFAKRWESRQGRSGYSPACSNEWVQGVCRKPRGKCADCKNRENIPVTLDLIRDHLSGKITLGTYPLLPDETSRFLAVDFDKEGWQDDVLAFAATCREKDIQPVVERSRSGNGAHVWFFFEKPIDARLARRFGCSLLTETMENRHQVGLDSYDRFFPNQDTMPKGGFGNLIALPLQPEPARHGNSLFIDRNFTPYQDQFGFLKTVPKLPEDVIRFWEEDAARKGRVIGIRMSMDDEEEEPWLIPPSGRVKVPEIAEELPETIELVNSNLIYIPKSELPAKVLNQILRIAAFQNPEFYKAQAMRLSTYGKPRVISCSEEFEKHIALPRGCRDEVTALLSGLEIKVKERNERFKGRKITAEFQGTLSEKQEEAVSELLRHDTGVLSAPTAFGKTVVGAYMIAARKTNTLVLVHRKQLLDQWRARLSTFLGLDPKSIGQYGSGKKKLTGEIDVAMLQSLHRKGVVEDMVADYGYIIVDECHHLSAFSFEAVLRQVKAQYITGLTATPIRKDGHHPIIFMQCGPIRYGISPRNAALQRGFEHKVILRHTETSLPLECTDPKINDVYELIIEDRKRTGQIIQDVKTMLESGKHPLILTERRAHLNILEEELAQVGVPVVVLHGGIREKKRRESMKELAEFPPNQPWVILATGRYIGEGFDEPRLDTLFLTMPVSWKGILQQYAGRLHRMHADKEEVLVFDYVDSRIEMTRRMFDKRKKGYATLGYYIDDPEQLFSDQTKE